MMKLCDRLSQRTQREQQSRDCGLPGDHTMPAQMVPYDTTGAKLNEPK